MMVQERDFSHINSPQLAVMLLFQHNIPTFLRSSPFLQALQSEGPIPAGGIEIPDGCLKQDLTIGTQQELMELLFTLRFWLLPEIAKTSTDLVMIFLNSTDVESLLNCTAEFRLDFPVVNELSEIVLAEPDEKVTVAAGYGNRPIVKHLVEHLGLPISEQAGVGAARGGSHECLTYLASRGLALSAAVCKAACTAGHPPCVQFVIENKTQWYRDFARCCAENGHFECVRQVVLFAGGAGDTDMCGIDAAFSGATARGQISCLEKMLSEWTTPGFLASVICQAAGFGRLDVLKFVHQQRGATIERMALGLNAAAKNGNMGCLQYLCELGCVLTSSVLSHAAECSDSEIFQFLLARNCPAHVSVCATLAMDNKLELLKLAHQHGCPWDERTCGAAAVKCHLEILKYAHQNGCPWRVEGIAPTNNTPSNDNEVLELFFWPIEDITLSAAQAQSVECLRYVVEQGGVPLDRRCGLLAEGGGCAEVLRYLYEHGFRYSANACVTAARQGKLGTLKYLREIGTPWNKSVCANASRNGHLDCLQYAHESGCPWDKATCTHAGTDACYEYAVAQGCPGAELERKSRRTSSQLLFSDVKTWDD